jgi:hypothetical protein
MAQRGRIVGFTVTLLLLLVAFGVGWLTGKIGIGSRVNRASLSDLERRFTDDMQGVALVGRFTVAGREDRPPAVDRYEISSVEKVGPNDWRFNARIQYGRVDTTLPLVLRVEWAGDTPVLTMTDVTIPNMGTFTVRILFYRDRYAGTWQHGQVGGHMFGRIEKVSKS